jgi:transcriptional regulator with XRE-family HTH domain
MTMLAKKAGISQTHASHLENGKCPFNSVKLLRLARALDVSPDYLVAGGIENWDTDELRRAGLVASENLAGALRAPAFLRFAEFCARAVKTSPRNLKKIRKAIGLRNET